MYTVTQQEKDLLIESALAAKGPGERRYVSNNAPRCVIGQLLYRSGVGIDTLLSFEEETVWAFNSFGVYDGISYGLLSDLQNMWDWHCADLEDPNAALVDYINSRTVIA